MSQSAEGVAVSELSRPGSPARTTKMTRIWELVSELIRVLVSREQQLPTSQTQPTIKSSPPAVPPRRTETRRRFFGKSSSPSGSIPSVWHDVQSRALENTLQRKAAVSRASSPEPATPAERPQPTGGAGEIDWSPFLIARIHDDFARPQVMPD